MNIKLAMEQGSMTQATAWSTRDERSDGTRVQARVERTNAHVHARVSRIDHRFRLSSRAIASHFVGHGPLNEQRASVIVVSDPKEIGPRKTGGEIAWPIAAQEKRKLDFLELPERNSYVIDQSLERKICYTFLNNDY